MKILRHIGELCSIACLITIIYTLLIMIFNPGYKIVIMSNNFGEHFIELCILTFGLICYIISFKPWRIRIKRSIKT